MAEGDSIYCLMPERMRSWIWME